jgi:hypothetical protein
MVSGLANVHRVGASHVFTSSTEQDHHDCTSSRALSSSSLRRTYTSTSSRESCVPPFSPSPGPSHDGLRSHVISVSIPRWSLIGHGPRGLVRRQHPPGPAGGVQVHGRGRQLGLQRVEHQGTGDPDLPQDRSCRYPAARSAEGKRDRDHRGPPVEERLGVCRGRAGADQLQAVRVLAGSDHLGQLSEATPGPGRGPRGMLMTVEPGLRQMGKYPDGTRD